MYVSGALGGIRTPNPLIRSQMLWSIELRAPVRHDLMNGTCKWPRPSRHPGGTVCRQVSIAVSGPLVPSPDEAVTEPNDTKGMNTTSGTTSTTKSGVGFESR
jgi:hypothetical protein